MHLISKCTDILAFICPSVMIISFIHYTIYYLCLISVLVWLLFCIYSSLYETVHVAWIKMNIECKSFPLNVKNKFDKVVGSAVLVTLKASDRGVVVYSLSLAFQFCRFYLG